MVYLLGHSRPINWRPLTWPAKIVNVRTNVTRAAKQVTGKQIENRPLQTNKPAVPNDVGVGNSVTSAKAQKARSIFPKFMQKYANRVGKAPLSHITSFLIVHELSAIVPLFGIWGAFYYMDYAPLGIIPDSVVHKGTEFIRKMAERNDWQTLAHAEKGSRILLQGAASYGIVKAIMPLRLAFSLWVMPWFARWFVIPVSSRISSFSTRLFRRNK